MECSWRAIRWLFSTRDPHLSFFNYFYFTYSPCILRIILHYFKNILLDIIMMFFLLLFFFSLLSLFLHVFFLFFFFFFFLFFTFHFFFFCLFIWTVFSSSEHEVLMVSYCSQSMSVVRRAASTIALKAYSSYTPGTIDLILALGWLVDQK